jgi:hypothetical protein
MANIRTRFEDQYIPEPNSGCWLWLGGTDGRNGYGRLNPRTWGERQAHRYSYRLHKGEIPKGLVIDHKCRNPSCVNPEHLEPVTQAENMARGNYRAGLAMGPSLGSLARKSRAECRKGHAWDERNTARQANGARMCRACHRDRQATYRAISCEAA